MSYNFKIYQQFFMSATCMPSCPAEVVYQGNDGFWPTEVEHDADKGRSIEYQYIEGK